MASTSPGDRRFDDGTAGVNVGSAILAGFVGTLAITALMYGGPVMGFPRMDIATMLGTMFVADMNTAFWLGMGIHFMMGSVILALIYAAIYRFLPGEPWLRGAIWGFVLWIMAQAVVMPMMGVIHPMIASGQMPTPGFFSLNMGIMAPIGSLIGHLVYGAILGALYGRAEPVVEHRAST